MWGLKTEALRIVIGTLGLVNWICLYFQRLRENYLVADFNLVNSPGTI